MTASIATYPPLGQVTQLREANVVFHAVLEVPYGSAANPWQVSLWHSGGHGGDWVEAELVQDAKGIFELALNEMDTDKARLHFTASLMVPSSLSFTVKFRKGPGHDWCWARDEQGLGDGVVIIDQRPTREDDPEDLPDLIDHLNTDLKWKSHMSQSPGTRLWSIEASVDGAKNDTSTYADVPVGFPWGRFLR